MKRNYAPWVLIVGYPNGVIEYYGEFASKARAEDYALSLNTDRNPRWHVKEMIAPHNPGEQD